MKYLIGLLVIIASSASYAHDKWGNGDNVPEWVKRACCDKADVHHVPPSAIHIRPDGYHIDGITTVTPVSRVQPSPDGEFWIFWREYQEPGPDILCFFAPVNGM